MIFSSNWCILSGHIPGHGLLGSNNGVMVWKIWLKAKYVSFVVFRGLSLDLVRIGASDVCVNYQLPSSEFDA